MQCVSITFTDSNEDPSQSGVCVWRRTEPGPWMFVVYGFVVPVVACFGFCANFINTIVFMRPKMTPSAFTYLAALSFLDSLSCLLIAFTALSRSIFYNSYFWLEYDFQWQTPLFGITTGAGNLILACVSLDRLVYLWHGIPNPCGSPRFCKRLVARRMIVLVIIFSVALNFPYFFVFLVNEDGSFKTTEFYCSTYYKIHNWMAFILLSILPAIFLLIGNGAILIAFRRWTKQSQKLCSNSNMTQKRYQHQMKLTITILIVITLFMVGELPASLTSRKSAVNLLYGGDISKVNFEVMDRLEVICITLNAVQLSLNIIVYAVINPSFMPEFFSCLRGASDTCFKIFCLTTIGNFCKNRCGRKKRDAADKCENAPKSNDNEDSWSNSGQLATVEGCCRRARAETPSFVDNASRIRGSWKRSSSFNDFAYVNHGFPSMATDINEDVRPKRHSLGI